jgi:Icc-related predicted phosphoesterase
MSTKPTQEEMVLIREFIFLPLLVFVVEKNLNDIKNSQQMLKGLYIRSTQIVLNKINEDLTSIRQILRQSNIKVWETDKTEGYINYSFNCRGYIDKISFMTQLAKNEIGTRLSKYINEISQEIKTSS